MVLFLWLTVSPVITGDVSFFVEFTSDSILLVLDVTFIRISAIEKSLYRVGWTFFANSLYF